MKKIINTMCVYWDGFCIGCYIMFNRIKSIINPKKSNEYNKLCQKEINKRANKLIDRTFNEYRKSIKDWT